MNDTPRLIEHAFPLEQASLDSVHEKNVRHGHISTLHIWPARRPLAACRAALLATLLPDPGTPEKRRELCEKIGGKIRVVSKKQKRDDGTIEDRQQKETFGGVLRWQGQVNEKNLAAVNQQKADLAWFREQIREANGGRPPRVLDPFAGGGAIPLEAMRLGCEATAVDINPVAWFILKCTLEYPHAFAGQKRRLPDFALRDRVFMASYFAAIPGEKGRPKYRSNNHVADRLREHFGESDIKPGETHTLAGWSHTEGNRAEELDADFSWHVRAWGRRVAAEARRELAPFFPTYADWEPVKKGVRAYEARPTRLVPLRSDGMLDIESLNDEASREYLDDPTNPRWVPKPSVAYLWARTVRCKDCGAEIPILKTRWLCKNGDKRVLLTMESLGRGKGVRFGVDANVLSRGGNAAQRREHDKKLGAGTMSRSGARCPCCDTIVPISDIRDAGMRGEISERMTAVIIDGLEGKDYRLPTDLELAKAKEAVRAIEQTFEGLPFGIPNDPLPAKEALGFRVPLYGLNQWHKLYLPRQLLVLGVFARTSRRILLKQGGDSNDSWAEALLAVMAAGIDRLADRGCSLCQPDPSPTQSGILHTFARFALPMTWDFAEGVAFGDGSGGFVQSLEWVARVLELNMEALRDSPNPQITRSSASSMALRSGYDAIITDPPYYDAIPYSDLMDFFYVWLRRTLAGVTSEFDVAFKEPLSPKWDHEKNDGELIDDASRHGGDKEISKRIYEDGMARVFGTCRQALAPHGRLVIVFAHKHPDAWETLVSAIIRAGFVVDGSWPIATERGNRMRALSSAALSSSVWLVCRKRPDAAKPGWDNRVLEAMRTNIAKRLREFWDAGIRGPDFVWAATGPALEAYSQHPIVRKADDPGALMTVAEFLNHARRMVVDYVVGQVLSGEKSSEADWEAADRLDEVTAYYLLHRHDFKLNDAPVGPVILYAVSCGLSDAALVDTWDVLQRVGSQKGEDREDEEDDERDAESEESESNATDKGSKMRLKSWAQRKGTGLGYEAPGGRPVPLVDRVHRLMHLWREGDLAKVDDYIDENGLRRHELFKRVVQSLIELAEHGSSERALLESISNHLGAKGAVAQAEIKLPS